MLLQTAKANVYGADRTKKIVVNVLFDGGSQRSYKTEEARKKLNLNPKGRETLNLNTFGSGKCERKIFSLVDVNVEVEIDEPPIVISALSYPSICISINTCFKVNDYVHLQGLKLADAKLGKRNRRIDLLIGADFLYEIVSGEVIKGNFGPVAIKSKLCWILAGTSQSYSDTLTGSNVISNLVLDSQFLKPTGIYDGNEEINETLKMFWKHESSGLSDDELNDKNYADATEKMDIRFNGERYEVGLPWTFDWSQNLNDNYSLALGHLNSLYLG